MVVTIFWQILCSYLEILVASVEKLKLDRKIGSEQQFKRTAQNIETIQHGIDEKPKTSILVEYNGAKIRTGQKS